MSLATIYKSYQAARDSQAKEGFAGEYEALVKSLNDNTATAGFQTPLVPADGSGVSSDAPYSPLIPQALDDLVGNLDFRPEHLKFWDWLPKKDAAQTVVDWATIVSNGDPWLDCAQAEGEVSSNDTSTSKKGSTRIKSYTQRREITDIANAVVLGKFAGVSTSQLEQLTKQGMLAMFKALEVDALFANSTAQQFKIDGVINQLKNASQYTNLDGSVVTMEYLEGLLRNLTSAPYYARPTHCFVPPKVYTTLSKQQNGMLIRKPDGQAVTYGFDDGNLQVTVGGTVLKIEELKFLDERGALPMPTSSQQAGKTVIAIPAFAVAAPGADAASKFAAGDAGTYHYASIVVGKDGSYAVSNYSGAAVSRAAVAAQSSLCTLTGDASYAGGYWVLCRTAKGAGAGSAADQTKFEIIARVAIPGAANVTFTDQNLIRNNCGRVLILRQDPEEIVCYKLISMFRKPLAQTGMTQPFALFTAVGLQVKVPEHQWLLENCGIN